MIIEEGDWVVFENSETYSVKARVDKVFDGENEIIIAVDGNPKKRRPIDKDRIDKKLEEKDSGRFRV